MARTSTSFRFEPGDVPRVDDDPDYSFFFVHPGSGIYAIVDDETWDEAEAFARAILDGITKRRALKAEAARTAASAVEPTHAVL
jgi:hypothetical protein